MRFEGHQALITGGASGIGLATARRMAGEGARLILWDIDAQALDRAAAAFGPQALCQRVDVTDEHAVQSAMADAMAQCGRLDIVVNSAGIVGPSEPFWRHSLSAWQRVIDLNLTAIFLVCRAAVPHLSTGGTGRIVNLASIAGKEGNANQAAYSASKAGVIGLTKSMAKDLVDRNILVNAVAPAIVHSALVAQMPPSQIELVLAKIPMKRTGRVEEVAALVCWLASSECSFSTGAVYDASGGRATY
ncbi:oxidoreductase [Pseudorhodoferax aquiterrae]|uniref:Oxidoreductase n=1 Tax=Pseudorhodoferax aquiterrae TaxID=747304 RepID=A0ABQ3G336_9BURK|nr:SDR family NAD(P)-dependent oxidoreductase [Pseudorhodoferax aquiterrae]GHC84378.1 oxidoreductase [Pseudorhodoferax aquiterrae]